MFGRSLLPDTGSTEEYWKRQDAAQIMAQVKWIFIAFSLQLQP